MAEICHHEIYSFVLFDIWFTKIVLICLKRIIVPVPSVPPVPSFSNQCFKRIFYVLNDIKLPFYEADFLKFCWGGVLALSSFYQARC